MRTHEHALVSVSYVFVNSLVFNLPLDQGWLYISAILGGEIIDFIDHPLHFFFYGRKQEHVLKSKEIFRSEFKRSYSKSLWNPFIFMKSVVFAAMKTINYLNVVEDKRGIKGLWLHNVLALLVVSLVGLIASLFVGVSPEFMVFYGALLLHLICDVFGDLWSVGHIDNWLWVVPVNARRCVQRNIYMWYVLILNFIVFTSFSLIAISWGIQTSNESIFKGLLFVVLENPRILLFLPWIGLALYLFWFLVMAVFCVRKYNIDFRQRQKTKKEILRFLYVNLRNKRLSNIYLWLQSNISGLTVIGTCLTALAVLIAKTFWKDNTLLLFITPFVMSITLGALIHSSVGELSGVFGVVVAYFTNILLARIGVQEPWASENVILIFESAVVAWIVGLIGGLIFRGKVRMSLVLSQILIQSDDLNHDIINNILGDLRLLLEESYSKAHFKLFGASRPIKLIQDNNNPLVLGVKEHPVVAADDIHWRIKDSYCPLIRELAYLWGDRNMISLDYNCYLPIMPRTRTSEIGSEMRHLGQTYEWYHSEKLLRYYTPVHSLSPLYLSKSVSEFIDNLLTIRSGIVSDVFISIDNNL
ncbi:MAG: hypothetical protein NZM44_07210, partial [Candidatus Calescibacterium sp.]|nr:hypothetical protein [Candidatus Calescibacterium sp.]